MCSCAGDSRALSLPSCFPFMRAWEVDHGSVVGGAWRTRRERELPSASKFVAAALAAGAVSFVGGMSTLPLALARRLVSALLPDDVCVCLRVLCVCVYVCVCV